MATPQDTWNEGLKLVSFCPVCETRYNEMEARVLAGEGETQLLHVQCRKCHNSLLALVHVNQIGASSVGLLTDLCYDDVVRFRAGRQLTIDDVIEAHEVFSDGRWIEALGGVRQGFVTGKAQKHEKQLQEQRSAR
jgi:hypothetical protein